MSTICAFKRFIRDKYIIFCNTKPSRKGDKAGIGEVCLNLGYRGLSEVRLNLDGPCKGAGAWVQSEGGWQVANCRGRHDNTACSVCDSSALEDHAKSTEHAECCRSGYRVQDHTRMQECRSAAGVQDYTSVLTAAGRGGGGVIQHKMHSSYNNTANINRPKSLNRSVNQYSNVSALKYFKVK